MINWKAVLAKCRAALLGLGAAAILAGALALYAPLSALWSLAGVPELGAGSRFRLPTHSAAPVDLPPAPQTPAKGRHKWHAAARPVTAAPCPILVPDKPADLEKLNLFAGLDLGKTEDLLASANLGHGSLFTVLPRDGSPAREVYVAKTHEFGGAIALNGRLLTDFRGKVESGQLALEADLFRWKRLQLRGGPGLTYDQAEGARFGVLVSASLCLAKCG